MQTQSTLALKRKLVKGVRGKNYFRYYLGGKPISKDRYLAACKARPEGAYKELVLNHDFLQFAHWDTTVVTNDKTLTSESIVSETIKYMSTHGYQSSGEEWYIVLRDIDDKIIHHRKITETF